MRGVVGTANEKKGQKKAKTPASKTQNPQHRRRRHLKRFCLCVCAFGFLSAGRGLQRRRRHQGSPQLLHLLKRGGLPWGPQHERGADAHVPVLCLFFLGGERSASRMHETVVRQPSVPTPIQSISQHTRHQTKPNQTTPNHLRTHVRTSVRPYVPRNHLRLRLFPIPLSFGVGIPHDGEELGEGGRAEEGAAVVCCFCICMYEM